jgi:hypothetical protein
MGYDLHITRAEDWTEAADQPIRVDEWLAVAAAHPDLAPAEGMELGFLLDGEDGVGLYWQDDGRIVVRGADEGDVPRLVGLADALGARLIGDDDERYRADGSSFEPRPMSTAGWLRLP